MRTDVKLGIAISMGVVLVAGGYFMFRGKGEAPVPVVDKSAAVDPAASKTTPAKPATTPVKPRQTVTNKDANRNLPVGPSTPTTRPGTSPMNSAAQPQPTTTALKPPVEPVKTETQPSTQPTGANPPVVSDSTAMNNPSASSTMPSTTSPSPSLPVGTNPAITTPPSSGSELPLGSNPSPTGTALSSSAPNSPTGNMPTLPASSPLPAARPDLRMGATESHRVQPGDSLETLAQTYYGNRKYAKFLADSNPQIVDGAKPPVGAFVKIPPLPADIDSKLAAAPNTPGAKPTAPATTDASGKRTYKVKAGDSFYRIAREQLGNAGRWKELLALNKTVVKGDPTLLQVGQTLVLPES